ncbi:xanthine dehydrogenase family protein molybdopterin-binding subunit [Dethiobacter alkaliphilus]|uniref:xanthine dehydrogenase family protein molybdopterin-binding subunit n=1 Tax=Dethiobacter alkaliphilus TaxID=427926 RepID=UPI0022260232|nr:molybdopterin cofactor-binding domain-containing protein [Dethiobacter alkaliphilus]MCW3490141.1 molybdopterin-dependent oxidoreductase [Dethiobacter alkaliphilus]
MNSVGKSIPKVDGLAITTGKPVYTEDLAPENALVIKILRSPHAFARIKAIDKTKAEMLDGVECILTHEDVPKTRFSVAGQTYPEPSPYDRLILEDIVRYVGDEVAIIAAVDEETALRAMKLIKVEYEVLEAVLDFEQAAGHKSVVHPEDDLHCNFDIGMDKGKNIVASHNIEVGDVEEELKKCAVVVEETSYVQAVCHAMMETYRAFSHFDHMGRLVVVSSTQIPFHVRRILARALNMQPSKIRVIKPRIGGGFGGKQTAVVEVFAALVTQKTGKPAIIVYDRKETFSCTNSRHAMRIKVRLGADKDGYIRVVDMEGLSDTGAYGEHAPTTFSVVGQKTLPLYNKAKAVRFHGKVVYTNKMPGGAFRGYGATQGTFALENAVNKLSDELSMDPAQLRLQNVIDAGEKSLVYITEGLGSSTLHQCIKVGKEMIGWDEKYPRQKLASNKVRAVGMAVTMQGSGIADIDTASAEIRLNDDGNYTLLIGSTDMGTGSDTILCQMAAEIMETSTENIIVHAADTDISPFDPGSYASSTTYVTGTAVVKAAEELKQRIVETAAGFLQLPPDKLEFTGDNVRSTDGGREISVKEIAERLTIGVGNRQLTGQASFGSPISPPPFIAGFAEVEVDKETGKVDLIDYVAVVDCGTVINPNLARIQAEGGLVQGIGMALYEDVRYDAKGKMKTNCFLQYKIPSRKDIGDIRVVFEESHEPTGPFGAKSIGEVVTNTPAPAIVHAVYNATGVRVTDLPVTPEKLLTRSR